MMFATFVALIVLAVVPILFVWDEVYQDGLVGRVSLVTISFSSVVFILRLSNGEIGHLWPETQLIIIAFAVFLIWSLIRFQNRVRKVLKNGKPKDEERRTGSERRFIQQ